VAVRQQGRLCQLWRADIQPQVETFRQTYAGVAQRGKQLLHQHTEKLVDLPAMLSRLDEYIWRDKPVFRVDPAYQYLAT